mmetsp:Transcript_1169/g.1938  ORF Transcript_1169/g.1938 Transcript_1169/m.1938 type:complete len:205 (-) Transcript_1169:624-1238(-)
MRAILSIACCCCCEEEGISLPPLALAAEPVVGTPLVLLAPPLALVEFLAAFTPPAPLPLPLPLPLLLLILLLAPATAANETREEVPIRVSAERALSMSARLLVLPVPPRAATAPPAVAAALSAAAADTGLPSLSTAAAAGDKPTLLALGTLLRGSHPVMSYNSCKDASTAPMSPNSNAACARSSQVCAESSRPPLRTPMTLSAS